MYEKLFEPMKIGKIEIKNRFVMPPMDSHYTDTGHYYTDKALNYYGERAKGEFGLIITEYTCVSEEGLASKTQAGIYDDKFIPSLTKLVDRVHENGAHIFCQIHHAGRQQGAGATELPAVGASAKPSSSQFRKIHQLTTEEIPGVIQKFIDGAIRAQKAGFDGVEVHGAHGYLLAQFLSKGTNKRIDQYGGNTTNRARIVCEIIAGIKEACGVDFPVTVRISGDEAYYGGNTIEDAVAQAILMEKAGADAIHVSYGPAIQSYYVNAGYNIENGAKVKDAVSIPIIGVGRINDPAMALSMVETGKADFVALGRQSICDSHFPRKVKEGRIDEILVCSGCMQRCLYSSSFEEGFGTSCLINPFSGKENVWTIDPTDQPKKIAVVGAGPAGLQAAWILSKRGHDVTVYEKDATAGGQYLLASVPSMKQELAKTISTYLTFNKKYGTEILYNTPATTELLQEGKFDEIIIATGSMPIVPGIPGIKNENVYLANDVLKFDELIKDEKILVLGGGLVGAETAELLAEYNNEVTIVDMIDQIAPQAPKLPRNNLIDHLKHLNVQFVLNSKVQTINTDGIDYEFEGATKKLAGFDKIILAFGSRANNTLFEQIKDQLDNVHVIGDALQARDAQKAIFEATKLAIEL